jgi:ComF family protein
MKWISDVAGLLFPEACAICAAETRKAESGICQSCRAELPVVLSRPLDNHLPMMRKFEGILPIDQAFSFLQYTKSGNTQELLHALKYGRRPEIARQLGMMMAMEMLERGLVHKPDLILPVPMHPEKQAQRGYNQAMEFAGGLAAVFKSEVSDSILLKRRKTETQTRKSKLSRLLNVEEVFVLHPENSFQLPGKSVWLVDDVLTTGSTMLASASILCEQPISKLGIATIAMA